MISDNKFYELVDMIDAWAKLEQETVWAYAYDKPESVRKQLIADGVEARGKLIDCILHLKAEDFN